MHRDGLTPDTFRTLPPRTTLSRPRLARALDRVLAAQLALVVAPPGSGKTTLMSDWAQRFGGDLAWCRARTSDRDARTFTGSLAASVPGLTSGGDRPVGEIEDLARALESRNRPLLIVVDDLHLVRRSPAEICLEQLLLLAPSHVRMLLGSRCFPALNLARSELPAPVLVDGDMLAFRPWEIQLLCREVYGQPIAADEARQLARRTDGWAAALHLGHLAGAGRPPGIHRRLALTGSTEFGYLGEYLTDQVMAGLTEELRSFLRNASVLGVLTANRCDRLLDITTSKRLLRDLADSQALISTVDGGTSFRCHRVLRTHLLALLGDVEGAAGLRALRRRASRLLAAEGAVQEALVASMEALDWSRVRDLLRRCGGRVSVLAELGWMDAVPPPLTHDPWALLARARSLLDDGQLTAGAEGALQAEAGMRDAAGREMCRTVAGDAGAWAPGRPAPKDWRSLLTDAVRSEPLRAAEHAGEIAGPPRSLVRGLAFIVAGDMRQASTELRACADDPVDDGVTLSARLAIAVLLLTADDSDGLLAADSVAREADRLDLGWLARLSSSVVAAWSRCRIDGRSSVDFVGECETRGDAWGAALAAAAEAMAAFQTGRPDLRGMEDLVRRFRGLGAGALEAWARAGLAVAAAAAACPDARTDAMAAESMARSAAVPGALSLAYAALALSSVGDRDELLELAKASAHDAGMRRLPWLALDTSQVQDSSENRPTTTLDDDAPPLHIKCFGSFSLLVGDAEPDLSRLRPRARAALRLLALYAGRPVHREVLVEALWPELDIRAALHNVQVTMSSLRAVLDPGSRRGVSRPVTRDGETYALALPPGSTSDLMLFDSAFASFRQVRSAGNITEAATHLRRAVRLYAGDVLPEEGPADWVVTTREHYRLRAAEAAGVLAETALASGQPRVAAESAERSVAIDPFRDASWRVLVEAHVRAGDVAAAERARRAYKEVLASLGVPDIPAPRTVQLLDKHVRTV